MESNDKIYMDYQASTPIDPRVITAMEPFLSSEFGNPHSSDHVYGWAANNAVEKSRNQLATLLGCDMDEVIFTSGATEANNLALLGCARKYKGARKRIFVSAIEHKCILNIARALSDQYGFIVEQISVKQDGVVDLEWLEEEICEDVLLVSVMAVNNEVGSIQPLKKIGAIAERVGAYFHTDAAQAIGAASVDLDECNIDYMSLSAHKFYGPKGIGALYVRRDNLNKLEPVLYGGGQENNLRGGTLPTPLCVGMGTAAELMTEELVNSERADLQGLRDLFVSSVQSLPYPIKINGPALDNRHFGNANLCFQGFHAQDILAALQPKLAASSGSACTSGITEPSYVLREIGLSLEDAEASIRFSIGRFTTAEDIDVAVTLIGDVLDDLSFS